MLSKPTSLLALIVIIVITPLCAHASLVLSNYKLVGDGYWAGIGYHSFSSSGFSQSSFEYWYPATHVTFLNKNSSGTYDSAQVIGDIEFCPCATLGSTWQAVMSFTWNGLPVPTKGYSYLTLIAPNQYDDSYSVSWYANRSSGSATINISTNCFGYTPYLKYTSSPQTIPEPSSLFAILCGIGGLAYWRKRS